MASLEALDVFLGFGQCRFGGRYLRTDAGIVYLGYSLAFLHGAAFLDVEVGQAALCFGDDVEFFAGLEGTGQVQAIVFGQLMDLSDPYRNGRVDLRFRLCLFIDDLLVGVEFEGDQSGEAEDNNNSEGGSYYFHFICAIRMIKV